MTSIQVSFQSRFPVGFQLMRSGNPRMYAGRATRVVLRTIRNWNWKRQSATTTQLETEDSLAHSTDHRPLRHTGTRWTPSDGHAHLGLGAGHAGLAAGLLHGLPRLEGPDSPDPVKCTCPWYCYRCGRYPDDGGPDGVLHGVQADYEEEDSVRVVPDQRPWRPLYTFARTRVAPPRVLGGPGAPPSVGFPAWRIHGVLAALPVCLMGARWSAVRGRMSSKREQGSPAPDRVDYMLLGKIVAVCGLCGAGLGVVIQGLLMLVGLDSVQSQGRWTRWKPRGLRRSSRRKRSKGLHRRQ